MTTTHGNYSNDRETLFRRYGVMFGFEVTDEMVAAAAGMSKRDFAYYVKTLRDGDGNLDDAR